jgi:hypothetical protein
LGAPTAAFAAYNQIGVREDLDSIIYNIAPMDTYFFSHAGKGKATNVLHEWQTDSLDSPSSTNKYTEGDDFSAQAINPTTRLKNYCQIARKDFVITRTANQQNTAGRKEELAYQTVLKGKSLKRDIEKHLLSKENASAGTSASPRSAAAVETWIYTTNDVSATNVTTNTTPAPVSGLASTAGTDGTATAFAEGDLKNALQQAWSQGGETDVILLPPNLKNKLDNFTGVATRFRNVTAGQQAEITGAADVYTSSYGSHKVVLSRYCRASVVLCLDMSTWSVDWFDPIQMVEIAKSGDSEKRMLVGEYTLKAKTPTANTKMTNIT